MVPHSQNVHLFEQGKSMAKEQLHSKIYHDSHQIKNDNELCGTECRLPWDRTGVIIEVDKFRQYKIKLHGSGRISLCNRIHIKPLLHMKPHLPPKPDHYSVEDVTTLPYLTLPYLTLPYLTLPYLTLPYLTLPYLPYLTLPYLTLPYLITMTLHHCHQKYLISLPSKFLTKEINSIS